jgi:site-specific DNA-methyltransferase (adenine-specific)
MADRIPTEANTIILGDNAEALPRLPEGFARLIYIDPPFNTGAAQSRRRIRAVADKNGDRTGFGGRRYRTIDVAGGADADAGAKEGTVPGRQHRVQSPFSLGATYEDSFDDFLAFLMPRVQASLRCLTSDGSFFLHLDYREVHYAKVAMDALLGRSHFMNEIIWAYDFGARQKSRWPTKHDTILWYAMDPGRYVFHYDQMDRIPYMAPGLVGPEKAARGKTPTDVWWHTIVPTSGREKTGYPTQKPLGVLNRIIRIHTDPGDAVLDFFAGSGTTGDAAAGQGRRFVLIDNNPDAAAVMARRLARFAPRCVGFKKG